MGHKTGKEMKSLLIAVSIMTLILVIAIIAYFVIDVTLTTNSNIKDDKAKMIDQSVVLLQQISGNLLEIDKSAALMQYFDQQLLQSFLMGDLAGFYNFAVEMAIHLYPIDYVSMIKDGEVKAYRTKAGITVDPATLPVAPTEGDYTTLDSFGGKKGFFICVFYSADLRYIGVGQFQASLIIDRTEQAADIESYFNDQRNDLLLWMLIGAGIALILTFLLTTIGLRYFTNKYVVMPIEKLNRRAQEIMDGTFEGEVEVDPDSAYAALQGLLRSGKKVLRRMNEHMEE
ncbi:MAG: hypothetical protein A2V52_08630 [Actinobacteria bacterium RBG_19FT_COMBO_54_7]|uniref:HAMP domain-containing protein n=1 Tax=Candidatus Solincola sediminis TaxID=1797199 RepID=A0A1F2WNB5_9ACTN|nr:MAG: hypothetical protein A2Y75_01915 [Candidatus Solincola sediminis]OFW60197.1 MAG: hypothetical protein A2W01_08610 [Candidatus Solincola sediminis]OFW65183.1 MAG: hypothetical protein A2V52_08630 [Actinobacteria bacterium RBG_19FT_COMBO_54_7]